LTSLNIINNFRNGCVFWQTILTTENIKITLRIFLKIVEKYAREKWLKRSYTFYKACGRKGYKETLRFSKSGCKKIENEYSCHYGWFKKDA
jgi:hypothetical protein